MKVLFDIVHPAHVHFYRYVIQELKSRRDMVFIASRRKDVTVELLDDLGISHTPISEIGAASRISQASELLRRNLALWRLARSFDPDLILTRNPSGVQVARLCGACGIFDTDDGLAAGLLFRMAAPFAHIITTPEAIGDHFGPKHRTYPSYKALAYLHPNRFIPDERIRERLGLASGKPYSLMRLVDFAAVHDKGMGGISGRLLERILDRLTRHGQVFISSERPLPSSLVRYRADIAVADWHHALAFADVVVGDSNTVCIEAVLLGTPSINISTFSGQLETINELERRYGLLSSHLPGEDNDIMDSLDRALTSGPNADFNRQWTRMLNEHVDLTEWYLDLIEELRPF